jgi:ACS family hexuronate transporter-like MFS transporter
MGEAGNWPAGVKVVAEWFPERERALASGIFNSGSAVGAIVAVPTVAYILLHFGWRWAFIAVGLSGFAWLLVWWPVYYTPPESAREAAPLQVNAWKVFRTRFVWSFTLAKIFMDPVWYFYIFWFPKYLKTTRGFDMAAIGESAWIPFVVAGFGNILGGMLSAALLKRSWSLTAARKTAVTVFAALMLCAIPAVLAREPWVAIACVSLAMVGYTGSTANMLAFPSDVFPKNVVGSVYGLGSMGAGFGGMVFTLITGWAIERYSYVPVFIGFGIIPLICAAIVWTLLGPLTYGAAGLDFAAQTNYAQQPQRI